MKKALHYIVQIEGSPVGSYKITKSGSFFYDRRWYSIEKALRFALMHVKSGKEVQVECMKSGNFNGSKVWDTVWHESYAAFTGDIKRLV